MSTFGFMLLAPVVIFMMFVAPIWIVAHYLTRWRTAKTLSGEDEKVLTELLRNLDRMETRINTLERILDAETPDWRRRL
jgi:phage shock protein B